MSTTVTAGTVAEELREAQRELQALLASARMKRDEIQRTRQAFIVARQALTLQRLDAIEAALTLARGIVPQAVQPAPAPGPVTPPPSPAPPPAQVGSVILTPVRAEDNVRIANAEASRPGKNAQRQINGDLLFTNEPLASFTYTVSAPGRVGRLVDATLDTPGETLSLTVQLAAVPAGISPAPTPAQPPAPAPVLPPGTRPGCGPGGTPCRTARLNENCNTFTTEPGFGLVWLTCP